MSNMPQFDDDFDDDDTWNVDKILGGDMTDAPTDIVDTPNKKHSFDGNECPKCGNGIIHGTVAPLGSPRADPHIDGAMQAFMDALPPWMRGHVKIMQGPPPDGHDHSSGFHPGRGLKDLDEASWDDFLENTAANNGNAPLLRSLLHVVGELTDPNRIEALWRYYMLEHKMMCYSSMSEATRFFFKIRKEHPERESPLGEPEIAVLQRCHDDLLARCRLLYEEYCELAETLGLVPREEFSDPQKLCPYDDNPLTQWTALTMLGHRLEEVITLKEVRNARTVRAEESRTVRDDDDVAHEAD